MKNRRRLSFAAKFVSVILLVGLTLGLLWRFTGWHERINVNAFVSWAQALQGNPWTPLVVLATYILAGLLMFVHAVLLWATVFAFDLPHAILYCEMGSIASALVVYGLGRVLRKDLVERIAGSRMGDVSRALGQKGILTIVLLHIFPICPFSILNLIAGATHIGFVDFLIGTVLGCTPGILVLVFFGKRLLETLHHPHLLNVLPLVAFVVIGFFVLRTLRRHTAGTHSKIGPT